jgi:hypothetical protein
MKLATTLQETKLIKRVSILIQAATKLVRIVGCPVKRKHPS